MAAEGNQRAQTKDSRRCTQKMTSPLFYTSANFSIFPLTVHFPTENIPDEADFMAKTEKLQQRASGSDRVSSVGPN